RISRCETAAQLGSARLQQMKEGAAAPVLRGLAFAGPPVVEYFDDLGSVSAPPECTALVNRMQRVEHDNAAGQPNSGSDGALAETRHQLVLGAANQAGWRPPTGKLVEGILCHISAPRRPP